MFMLCRSDVIMRRGNRTSLEALLHYYSTGAIDKQKPWRINGSQWSKRAKVIKNVDLVRVAGTLIFAWVRIDPRGLSGEVFERSIDFILKTQLSNGSWPILSHLKKGDLLTTAIAIHAIAIAKPIGWKTVVSRASDWLISQQNNVGCWAQDGGPFIYIHLFCLEAIRMSNLELVSFTVNQSRYQLNQMHQLVQPFKELNTIVLCEGDPDSKNNNHFDAKCLSKIFATKYPNVVFYSLGSCDDVISDKIGVFKALTTIFPSYSIIRVVDRDDMNETEVNELKSKGVKVLSLRNIESYLLDDEVLKKVCMKNSRVDLIPCVLQAKQESLKISIESGFQPDDLKRISGELYNFIKRQLKLTREGKNQRVFLRDYIAPLISEEMSIYKKLEADLFM